VRWFSNIGKNRCRLAMTAESPKGSFMGSHGATLKSMWWPTPGV
jgi:hypothetical protein